MKDSDLVTMLVDIKYDIKELKDKNEKLKEEVNYYRDIAVKLSNEIAKIQIDFVKLNGEIKNSKKGKNK